AEERGGAARAAADRTFTALRQAAVDGDDAGVEAARKQAAQILGTFSAAPLTEEERARRAIQLSKFVSLIPVEYDHGVEGTRVTAEFEIGEGVAFSKAARAAFSDLQGTLAKMDAPATAQIDQHLAQLDGILRGAQERPTQVPEVDTVKDQTSDLEDELSKIYPDAWEEQSDEGDFDLIQISLDRMEQQVAAGQYRQAEQTRVETYAVFEFGPERRLAAFDQGLANDIEGLIWFGAKDHDGLAQLLSHHASRQEISATRDALDAELENAAATLGDGASEATVITNAAIIVFREGLEGVLILAAITASFVGVNRRKKRPVLWGALAGLGVSILTFILAVTLLSGLQQYGEKLEAIVGIVAIGVLLLVMNWFFHRVYWTEWISGFHQKRKALLAKDDTAKVAFWSAQVLGLFTLGLTSVYREGFETVLFLQSLELSAGLRATVLGSLIGLAATGAVAVLTFKLQRKLPYKKMLIVTGVLLAFVLTIMVGATIRTLQGAGWFPITSIDLDVPYWAGTWLGIFPTWETIGGQVLALVFVIGSYFAAEYVRVKRPKKLRAKRAAEAERAKAAGEAEGAAPARERAGVSGD
ncbi:MAG TPA: FTR1 family protein, partial [Solirubrobacteraceae bacterium]|nr:FTR1 family protein [Solirubrobacteraceae bacterium]